MQRITSALMNKDINSKTAQDLIKTFSTATANVESNYFDNKSFKRIEKGLERFIIGSNPFASEEQSDQIDTVLIELYAYSNNLIRELETNDKFVNLSHFQARGETLAQIELKFLHQVLF